MASVAPTQHTRTVSPGAYLSYLFAGTLFGFVLVKAEVVSWYRIQEMFRFGSFHMYGVIGSAVVVGALSLWLLKRTRVRSLSGEAISVPPKAPTYARYILGGTIFGLGWALTGACPGPIAALIGSGLTVFVIVLLSALLGTVRLRPRPSPLAALTLEAQGVILRTVVRGGHCADARHPLR